nr:hypothetical protein [uncultured bacterium]
MQPPTISRSRASPHFASRVRVSSKATSAPALWPKNVTGRSKSGPIATASWSTSGAISWNAGSRNRPSRPGSCTPITSTSRGRARRQARKIAAPPPAYGKQNSLRRKLAAGSGRDHHGLNSFSAGSRIVIPRIVRVKISVRQAHIQFQVAVGKFLIQSHFAARLLRPQIHGKAQRHFALLLNEQPQHPHIIRRLLLQIRQLQEHTRPAFHLLARFERGFNLPLLRLPSDPVDQLQQQVFDANIGDRMAAALHRDGSARIEVQANQIGKTGLVRDDLSAVAILHINRFPPRSSFWLQVLYIHAERSFHSSLFIASATANFDQDQLLIPQSSLDPLALRDLRRVIAHVSLDHFQTPPHLSQHSLDRCHGIGLRLSALNSRLHYVLSLSHRQPQQHRPDPTRASQNHSRLHKSLLAASHESMRRPSPNQPFAIDSNGPDVSSVAHLFR